MKNKIENEQKRLERYESSGCTEERKELWVREGRKSLPRLVALTGYSVLGDGVEEVKIE